MNGDEFTNALLNVWEKQQKNAETGKDILTNAGVEAKPHSVRKSSAHVPGLIATAAMIALALIATIIVISVVKSRKAPSGLPVQNPSETPAETPGETQFRGLEMLDDDQYVILKGDARAIAELHPYQFKRTYRALGSMTENDDNITYSGELAEGFIDDEGNIYVKARRTMKGGGTDESGDIYAVRVIDDETARMLLDTDGLNDIGERQAYVLMHMLAQYSRMRLIVITPSITNSYRASQKAIYFTDEHIVTCFMEQSAPLVFYEFKTPYCTAINVIPYAGNEWIEKPWLLYSADDFAVYATRVLEKTSGPSGDVYSGVIWDEMDHYRYTEIPEDIYLTVAPDAGGTILGKAAKDMSAEAAISTFDRPKAEDERKLSFFGNEYMLKYIESSYAPLGDVFADSYYVKEKGRGSLIKLDPYGHVIKAEGFELLHLDIRPDDTADQVYETLVSAAGEYIDFSLFKRTSASCLGGTEGDFGLYEYVLSRKTNGIVIATVQISVSSNGSVGFYSDEGIYDPNANTALTEADLEAAMEIISFKFAQAFEGSGYTLTGVKRDSGEDVKLIKFRSFSYIYTVVNYSYTSDSTGGADEASAHVYLRLDTWLKYTGGF
ncbi:MAG: hypothetical protein J6330_00035 [Clostridia bacterium]|nr:hypothetical protein [Clostridia bacterium]